MDFGLQLARVATMKFVKAAAVMGAIVLGIAVGSSVSRTGSGVAPTDPTATPAVSAGADDSDPCGGAALDAASSFGRVDRFSSAPSDAGSVASGIAKRPAGGSDAWVGRRPSEQVWVCTYFGQFAMPSIHMPNDAEQPIATWFVIVVGADGVPVLDSMGPAGAESVNDLLRP
jgi:hypothetical protein